jgi:hypothetical protein
MQHPSSEHSSDQVEFKESFVSSLTCSILDESITILDDSITERFKCNSDNEYLENILLDFGLDLNLHNCASLLAVWNHSKDSTFSNFVVSISL